MKTFNQKWLNSILAFDFEDYNYDIADGGHTVNLLLKEHILFKFSKLTDLIQFVRFNKAILSIIHDNRFTVDQLYINNESLDLTKYNSKILEKKLERYGIKSAFVTAGLSKYCNCKYYSVKNAAYCKKSLIYEYQSVCYDGFIKTPIIIVPTYDKNYNKFIKDNYVVLSNLKLDYAD